MSGPVGYRWHLRRVMAEREMFATSQLVPRLAERGVTLSREQVYRLVTGVPQRLSLQTLAALCDILDCAPGDLVEPYRATRTPPCRPAAPTGSPPRPRRARLIAPPEQGGGGVDRGGTGASGSSPGSPRPIRGCAPRTRARRSTPW
ncbi:MAG: helix-turn-helix transcriptional regulator [Pseudonocardia sp.]|nr:helix-turn-helix transcriptional regulator [Pseudonocardia sp.]